MSTEQDSASDHSRRDFIKRTVAATAGLSAGLMASGKVAHAADPDPLRIGLIGCGGRGTGAANNCVQSSPNVELVAMGDLFEDRLERSQELLRDALGENYKVNEDRSFVGFDAYQGVLDTDIDLVLLTAPPGFRPHHLEAAVDAGKHIFAEKPVAVDPAGVQSVIASSERAAQKDLAIVGGTQRRHHPGYVEVMERMRDGAIGDVLSAQTFYNASGFRDVRERKPGMSDMEWQVRNWYFFTWLSGDHIVEQALHRIDLQNWAFQTHPVKATAVGGRQARVDPSYGHIYDHFGVEYQYPDGQRASHMCSQIKGSARRVGEHFIGTEGTADTSDRRIAINGASDWSFDMGEAPNPYVQEHANLIASIRAGEPLNEGRRFAESTLTAIMGREAAYTGKEVAWEDVMNADLDLAPQARQFRELPVPPVPKPGQTQLNRTVWGEGAAQAAR